MVSTLQAPLVLIGIILLFVHSGNSIQCYECNSHNDSKCALALPPDSLKKDCSEHSDGTKYTMCRKIVQNIEFEVNGNPPDTRVIRGCGWDDTSYKGKCYQRSGFGGRQEVCSCLTDMCNGALRSLGAMSYLTLALFAGLSLFVARL